MSGHGAAWTRRLSCVHDRPRDRPPHDGPACRVARRARVGASRPGPELRGRSTSVVAPSGRREERPMRTRPTSPTRSRTSTAIRTSGTRSSSSRPTPSRATAARGGRRCATSAAPTTTRSRTCWPPRQRGNPWRRSSTRAPPASRPCASRSSCRTTPSSAPASTRAIAPASSGCGTPARPRATSTSATTRAATARAARRSSAGTSSSTAAAPSTPRRWSTSTSATGSSASRATASRSRPPSSPARCASSPRRGATRCSPCCGAGSTTSACRAPASAPAAGASRCRAIPSQTVYVWFDALANYVTELGYAGDDAAFQRWWLQADERIHVVGKGITRFHAIYWPAILLSAGLPLPTRVLVHGYLTVDGAKIGKSSGNGDRPAGGRRDATAPTPCAGGASAPCRAAATPTCGPTCSRARAERLADGLGNLVNRTIALTLRAADGPPAPAAAPADDATPRPCWRRPPRCPARIDDAFEAYDLRAAAAAHDALVDATNRYVAATAPWTLLRPARDGDAAAAARLALVLATAASRVRRARRRARALPAARERASHRGPGPARPGARPGAVPQARVDASGAAARRRRGGAAAGRGARRRRSCAGSPRSARP